MSSAARQVDELEGRRRDGLEAPAPATRRGGTGPARGNAATLAVLLTGIFMASMDVAIVNVAAPRIEAGLHVSSAALQLVVSGYSLAYATLLVTGARLGDDHGHRRLFVAGLAGFTIASLACGLAWSGAVLVAARVVQGAAAAAMVPQVITLIQLAFEGRRRARAFALWATVISVGVVFGQVAGGALVSADIAGSSWRPVFLVNVPIGLGLLLIGPRHLPRTGGTTRHGLDLAGVGLLSTAVLLVMVPLVFGHQAHWAPWTWACLVAAAPVLTVLVAHLQRHRRRGLNPLIDLGLLRRPPVAVGLLSVCAVMMAYGGFLFSLTLHLQHGLQYTPLRSGLTFGPYAIGFGITSLGVPRLSPPLTRILAPVGLALLAASYVVVGVGAGSGSWQAALLLPMMALGGAGFGAGYSPVIARTVSHVPPANAPDASGLLNTSVQLSFALGVATVGSWFLDATGPGATASGHALEGAALAVGGLAAAASVLTIVLHRLEAIRPAAASTPAAAAAAAT